MIVFSLTKFFSISIHAPLAGCDPKLTPHRRARCHFNPRTPCGVRRSGDTARKLRACISIHAPHAGCDAALCRKCRVSFNFNPRTPCGVRRGVDTYGRKTAQFQSTHPMRGATAADAIALHAASISIHAPHAGCDRHSRRVALRLDDFNPRTPCGVRREHLIHFGGFKTISIHAPHAGCDRMQKADHSAETISIHAPHAGCDIMEIPATGHKWTISIHAPHAGCDRFLDLDPTLRADFNPRTPCGVRLEPPKSKTSDLQISIHAPHAGCDARTPASGSRRPDFNPRTPCGVRPWSCLPCGPPRPFQSTHPMRGATNHATKKSNAVSISIHAPHAGCDISPRTPRTRRRISIHAPHAGCDVLEYDKYYRFTDFNPRTPCGVRHDSPRA